jgi:hypothetical protein
MTSKPAYFERVRENASRRWNQLEEDPELAGPWHQLFKQVQSPRHVVSELLQNADDAGATEASVRIEDEVFVFEHNGEDFKESHFASLCRFGYSNKRALHTIGFRGIGFKSTFSLGNQVELNTPTLSVAFNKRRFSEPIWLENRSVDNGRTRIRVPLADQKRKIDVEKNLNEWLKNPLSLLFFKSIRKMQVGDQLVQWERLNNGPVSQSEWMALNGDVRKPYLRIRSLEESFPEESLVEVRQERMLTENEEAEFPPAAVEIVLGAEGRLFVVLPTEVNTALPFACNAPFIQEPARVRIKDPATSATNEWLLKRIGRLAATTMLTWIARTDLPIEERSKAYGLLSDVNREDASFEGICAALVELEIAETLGNQSDVLLTDDGRLMKEDQAVAIPDIVQEVWPGDQAAALLDKGGRPALARSIGLADRSKLVHWRMVDDIGKEALLNVLSSTHLPRPKTWRQLLTLWSYLAPEVTAIWPSVKPENLRIVPVQGKEVMYSASEVVRLGEKKLLQSEDDWNFLAEYLVVLNSNWNRFLADERLEAERGKEPGALKIVTAVYSVLKKIGLEETSDANVVVDRVAGEFFKRKGIQLADCVRMTQIAAALGASAGDAFRYVTRDQLIRKTDHAVMWDPTGDIEELLPPDQRNTKLLHSDYTAQFGSCSADDWARWATSARSVLLGFTPITLQRRHIYGQSTIKEEVKRRGVKSEIALPYKTNQFVVEDWDFSEDVWRYWTIAATKDEQLWVRVIRAIFAQPDAYWSAATSAKILQVATTGNTRSITWESLLPSWVLRLREVRCLPDTRNLLHKPRDLLRRTVETDAYRDVEPFVHPILDREAKAPLLDLLGVRDEPLGPHQMIDRLRALAKAQRPPIQEVEKWYLRLDEAMNSCSTADTATIKRAFRSEKLILSEAGDWSTTTGIYLSDDLAVPGAAVVRSSMRHLSLWTKIQVEERPTSERAIQWLRELPSGQTLPADDARRVRALLPLHAITIWNECGHWINLTGDWCLVENLKYAVSMQSLVTWTNLHEPIKQQTADFRELSNEVSTSIPFSILPPLASKVEERLQSDLFLSTTAEPKLWMRALGASLRRIDLEDEVQKARIRSLGENLAKTTWQTVPILQVVPYIDGTPAGTPRRSEVLWLDGRIYVGPLSSAKLAKKVPEEIGKVFSRSDIKAALDYSFERSAEDVRAYMEENFTLTEVTETSIAKSDSSQIVVEEEPIETAIAIEEEQSAIPVPDGEESIPDDEEISDELPSTDEMDKRESRRTPTEPKPPKPGIIERFALSNGFRKDGEGRFFHSDGSWIAKSLDMRFPWERRASSGEVLVYYWPAECCLEHEPLELESDVWNLISDVPGMYSLIVVNSSGDPLEMSGIRLRELIEKDKLKLFPASYRLAIKIEEHA